MGADTSSIILPGKMLALNCLHGGCKLGKEFHVLLVIFGTALAETLRFHQDKIQRKVDVISTMGCIQMTVNF